MSRSTNTVLATLLLLVAAPGYASSHVVAIAWTGDGRFSTSVDIEPGKFVEVCGKLNAGDAIRWAFVASAPLDFNIHFHVGTATEFPAKQTQVSSGEDTLRIAVREDYCWMWRNASPSQAKVEVSLRH